VWCAIENTHIPFPVTIPAAKDVAHSRDLIYQEAVPRDVPPFSAILIKLQVYNIIDIVDRLADFLASFMSPNVSRKNMKSPSVKLTWIAVPN
jgi:hypothetical protein